jgi:2',3'-cyclic-nucleotide 2'-phosphodiesterase (5'-nucleotidase family)
LFTKGFQLGLIIILSLSCRSQLTSPQVYTADLQTLDTSQYDFDTAMAAMIKPYHDSLELEMTKIIGHSAHHMDMARPQSKLGNFVCDLLLKEEYGVPVDVCFMNYGGLRTSLPKGVIKTQHIFELMPFENQLVLVKMSFEELNLMFFKGIEEGGEPYGSTIGMRINVTAPDSFSITYNDIVETKIDSFWVLTNDYIYFGGDGYDVFKSCEHVIMTGLLYRDILLKQIKKSCTEAEPAKSTLDDRLIFE